jgi:hypothetical protein
MSKTMNITGYAPASSTHPGAIARLFGFVCDVIAGVREGRSAQRAYDEMVRLGVPHAEAAARALGQR